MVAYRRILPVAALLLFACSSSGTSGAGGGFVGTGAPGNAAETPSTGSNVPASSDALPVAPTPDSICGHLCSIGLKYQCVSPEVGLTVASCTAACNESFAQITKDISLDCWSAIIQIIDCADRAHALSCKQKCDQTVGAGGAAPNAPSNGQNCTSELQIDEQVAVQCESLANRFPQCKFDFGGSTTNCDGIQDPCAKCQCQHGLDTAACTDACATPTCQLPDCTGCTTACDACLCMNSGNTTACTASCG